MVSAVHQGHGVVVMELGQYGGDEVLVPGDSGHHAVQVGGDRGQGDLHERRPAEGRENRGGHLDGGQAFPADIAHDDPHAVGGVDHFVQVPTHQRFLRR